MMTGVVNVNSETLKLTTTTMLKMWQLVCVAVVYGEDSRGNVDNMIAAKDLEMQQMFLDVEHQLSAAQQVAGLFVLEDAQLEMFALETRAKLLAIHEEVRQKIAETVKEVENCRQAAVEDVITWRKTLQGLKDATQRNQQTLQRMKKKKEDKIHLELEKEMEPQAEEELKQLYELEILQELENKKTLEREQLEASIAFETEQEIRLKVDQSQQLEKHKMENQCDEREISEASSSDLNDEYIDTEKTAKSSESGRHGSAVNRLLTWHIFAEHTLVEAVVTIYRQFVVPVVAIIGLFVLLTVVIARYNALKQTRRHRRVLYSGYPNSYRPKPQSEQSLS